MTILITGANRGIGRAMYDAYVAKGETVIGTRRDTAGDGWLQLDVTDTDSIEAMAASLGDTPLDLLVCNAGIFKDRGMDIATGYPADVWAEEFATNVTGVFLGIQAMLPALKAAKGKIAIISSQMASDADAAGGAYIYRASKAAVLNLGRNLARDLQADGIAVGIYHPGWVQTDMGGTAAAITPKDAATGLLDRFADLSLKSTGCFKTWDGRDHAF